MADCTVGNVYWSAYMADDGSGCYGTPHQVKVVSVSGGACRVLEKTSYGWSGWTSIRKSTELFHSEREAWTFLQMARSA